MVFILVLHNMRGRDVYSQAIFRGVRHYSEGTQVEWALCKCRVSENRHNTG